MATQDRPLDDQRSGPRGREASVAGRLSDMGVADLVQTLEMGKKSGALHLWARTGARATCYLRAGRVVDCELVGGPPGEEAFYRILRWRDGWFAIEFKPSEREERIQLPTQALLLQGMRRIDELDRAAERLPPLDRRLEVDVARLGERLAKIPDGANALLRLFDGRRTLAQVIEEAPGDGLAAADTVARLLEDGILKEARSGEGAPAVAPLEAEPPRDPAPEPGGVDWFAGPVGPEVAVAPVASWVLAPASVAPDGAAPPGPPGGDWLEPPAPAPSVPAPARAAPPRPAARFSIPVPPPGTLPPPPSVAETLARYQVVPRAAPPAPPASMPTPAPTPALAPEPAALAPEQAPEPAPVSTPAPATSPVEPSPEPAASAPAQLAPSPECAEPFPERAAPVEAQAAPASGPVGPGAAPATVELARRLAGKPAVRRVDPASLPLHLEEPPVLSRPQPAPRPRSALPYVALGGLVVAAIVGGTALTRSPRDGAPPAGTAPPAPADAHVGAAAPAPAPAGAPAAAPALAAPATEDAAAPPAAVPVEEIPASGASATPAPAADQPDPAPERAPATAAAPVATAAAPVAAKAAPARTVGLARPPTGHTASGEPDTRKLLATADRKYAAGRYAEAIADYRRAIALKPTAAARVALARALYDGHRSPDALRELDVVISANPRDAGAWLLRGDIYQGEGRHRTPAMPTGASSSSSRTASRPAPCG